MKISLSFKALLVSLSLLALFSIFYLHNISNPLLCERSEPFSESNLFWKIEQTGRNSWDVFFRNVNVAYQVTSSPRPGDFHNQDFLLREIYPNTLNYVEHTSAHNNISDAVMTHFNSIQRGDFHTYLPNVINPNSHGRGIRSPLDQFEIRDFLSISAPVLGNLQFSLANIGLYLTIAAFLNLTANTLAINYNKIVSNNWSVSQESVYATIYGIVLNQINAIKGQKYFPFISTLFIFILINNLMGMVPYTFASTSHFVLTFFVSFTVVLGATILGFQLHQLKFFSLFVPSGCPLGLLPLLVLIEFISYLARNVSLGLRLAANILSGHMLLNILSGFAYKIISLGLIYFFFGLMPLAFIIAFSGLELGISFIQAQVFVVLSCSYIKDGLDLH